VDAVGAQGDAADGCALLASAASADGKDGNASSVGVAVGVVVKDEAMPSSDAAQHAATNGVAVKTERTVVDDDDDEGEGEQERGADGDADDARDGAAAEEADDDVVAAARAVDGVQAVAAAANSLSDCSDSDTDPEVDPYSFLPLPGTAAYAGRVGKTPRTFIAPESELGEFSDGVSSSLRAACVRVRVASASSHCCDRVCVCRRRVRHAVQQRRCGLGTNRGRCPRGGTRGLSDGTQGPGLCGTL
jgi:hypothetical protein